MSSDNYWLIIPATGIGARMNGELPKQYLTLANKRTVLDQTLHTLLSLDTISGAVIVIAQDDDHFQQSEHYHHPKLLTTTIGGKTRQHSVLNGLNALSQYAQPTDWVLVHDASRPCVNKADVRKLIAELAEGQTGGLLATPVVDTLKEYQPNITLKTIKRTHLWHAQTPQMYRFNQLLSALTLASEKAINYTDETQAIENAYPEIVPKIIEGSRNNIKITYAEDLALADFYLSQHPYTDAN